MKHLSFFALLLLLLLPCGVFAEGVYADITREDACNEMLHVLTELSVFSGIEEDGRLFFKGDRTLTRAEAAALAVRLLNAPAATEGLAAHSRFSDVPAEHWAASSIAYLTDLAILAGVGDGCFAPEEPLLGEQFVKILVCLLGYAPQAEAMGGYPVGYLATASSIGLLKGCTAEAAPLSRFGAARLCYNALDIALMKQVLWSNTAEHIVTGTHADYPEETLLTSVFDATKYRGIVTETHYRTPVNKDEPYILLATKDGSKKIDAADVDVTALLGYSVVAYTVIDEDTDAEKLLLVTPRSENTVQELLLADTELKLDTKGRMRFSCEEEAYYADADAVFYCNGDSVSADEALELAAQTGRIVLLSNDGNLDADYVFFERFGAPAVVEAVKESNGLVLFKNDTRRRFDEADDSRYITFIKNGTPTTLAAVAPESTLSVVENEDGTLQTVYISEAVVAGKVSAVSKDRVTIGGVAYKLLNTLSLSVGDSGYFYLDITDTIVWHEEELSVAQNEDFGYLYSVAYEKEKLSASASLYAKLMDCDGFINELCFAKKVTLCYGGEEYTTQDSADFLSNIRQYSGGVIRFNSAEGRLYITEGSTLVVQYSLNEHGEIKKISFPKIQKLTDSYLSGKTLLGVTFEKADMRLANIEVAPDTVIFTVKNGDTSDIDFVSVGHYATILEKNTKYFGYGYVAEGSDASVYNALCLFVEEKTVPGDAPFIVAEEYFVTENQDGALISGFWGYTDGKSDKRLFLLAEDAVLAEESVSPDGIYLDPLFAEEITAGDTFAALYNDAGEITHLTRLLSAERIKNDPSGFLYTGKDRLEEDIEIHFGFVYERKEDRNGKNIYLLSAQPTTDAESTTELSRLRESRLVGDVYLVNLTRENITVKDAGDFDDIEVLNIDIRDGKTHKDGYGYFVYAKLYEDEIVGAVIYIIDCEDLAHLSF